MTDDNATWPARNKIAEHAKLRDKIARLSAKLITAADDEPDCWGNPRRVGHPDQERRARLLAHYASRPATEWVQYDAIPDMPGGDGLASADADGDILYSTTSAELWHGHPVRAHIARGTDAQTAARLLRKIADWVERSGWDQDGPGQWPHAGDGGQASMIGWYSEPADA